MALNPRSFGTTFREYERKAKILKAPKPRFTFVRMRRWYKALMRELEKSTLQTLLQAVAIEFLKEVIPRTPVDTGQARASWTVYLGAKGKKIPNLGDISKVNKALPPELNLSMIQKGRQMGEYMESLGRGTIQFVTIISNIPYMLKLEHEMGWSSQATYFIRVSLLKIQPYLKAAETKATMKALVKSSKAAGITKTIHITKVK